MSRAADEAELDPSRRVDDREQLLVAGRIDDDIGEHRDAGLCECILDERGIQHLDRHVLDAGAMACEVILHRRIIAGTDEDDRDATGVRGDDVGVLGRLHGEAECGGERTSRIEIGDGHDDVVDAHGDGVECGEQGVGNLRRWCARVVVGDFDAMGFGEHRTEDLFGEVGIDSRVDRPLATRGEHLADARWLDDARR